MINDDNSNNDLKNERKSKRKISFMPNSDDEEGNDQFNPFKKYTETLKRIHKEEEDCEEFYPTNLESSRKKEE